jgi:zinc protease
VRLARIELEARGGEWKRALEAGASELARVRAEGFSQAELDQQIAASRRALVRDAAPRTSTALADAIIDAVNRRIVFTQPADPAGTDAYLAQVRLADVNAAFRALWNDQTRLLFVSHGRSIPNGEAAVLAAWHSPDLR